MIQYFCQKFDDSSCIFILQTENNFTLTYLTKEYVFLFLTLFTVPQKNKDPVENKHYKSMGILRDKKYFKKSSTLIDIRYVIVQL